MDGPPDRSELDREVGLDAVLHAGAELAVIANAQIEVRADVEVEPGFDNRGVPPHRAAADGESGAGAEGMGRGGIDSADGVAPADHAPGSDIEFADFEFGFAADTQRQMGRAGIARATGESRSAAVFGKATGEEAGMRQIGEGFDDQAAIEG